jgi:predicted small secreted protein
MKHVIYALLALCMVVSGCSSEDAKQAGRTLRYGLEAISSTLSPTSELIITSPITGEKIQVALQDCGEMSSVEDAEKACANLGDGWRLPAKEELLVMYKELHKNDRGDFCGDCHYWSSTGGNAYYFDFDAPDEVRIVYFPAIRVRAVRAL